MSRVRTALLLFLPVLIASLLLARAHPFGDAGLYTAKRPAAPILNHGQVPGEVHAVLVEKCADCHSDQPRVPLYGRLAPASWLMERDIVEARKVMNLSQWDSYSADQQQTLAAKMVQETKSHDMPPLQYRLIHWNAAIAQADVAAFAGWAHSSQGSGSGVGTASQLSGEGDPARGKALFEKRCVGCHALAENHEGPALKGVYGSTSGTAAGFAYSAALKKAAIVWDDKSLDKWLTDPDAFIAGNDMDFLVSKPQERQDLISYLRQSSGK
jgi:cytochrome c